MRFDILTIFPEILEPYFKESLLARAQKEKLIDIRLHNIRDYSENKHKSVDDRPYGGGLGMVLKIEPIFKALKKVKLKGKNKKIRVIVFSPRGKTLTQKKVHSYSKLDQLIMISGRYEGIDERVHNLADEVVSVGDYILMGGEIAALAAVESVCRLVPGVIGVMDKIKTKPKFRRKERKQEMIERIWGFSEYPQYTRPEIFSPDGKKKWRVPKVLLGGDHKKIKEWRDKNTIIII